MAFDQPLEADRVDDLGFISTFVRAPIVGTLMWILGGDEAKKQQEQEEQQLKEHVESEGSCSAPSSPPLNPTSLNKMIEHNRNKKLGRKTAPRLIGSDLSDFGDCAIQAEAEALEHLKLDQHAPSTSVHGKRPKRLSWSDESGLQLVAYVDESIARDLSSQSISRPQRQVKSAMKRSRSTRNEKDGCNGLTPVTGNAQVRYIPKGLSANHNGLIMPTKPFSNDDGYVSPQWGWYINTTPPTPDMFHRGSSLSKSSTETAAFHRRPATLTNPAFKAASQKNPMHWPSVPL